MGCKGERARFREGWEGGGGEGAGSAFGEKQAEKLLGEGDMGWVWWGEYALVGALRSRAGVGGGNALRWSGFAGAKSDSYRDFPCLVYGDAFFEFTFGALRFFQNSIALPLVCMMAIRFSGGRAGALAGAWGGVGGGTILGGWVFGAPNLTLRVTFPVSSTVTIGLSGSFLGAFLFFQNSIAFS